MNFDQRLQMSQTRETYLANKRKAGSMGSTAGRKMPSSKANMAKARLFSPQLVGQSLTITPKHPFMGFKVGSYYEWEVYDEGEGMAAGVALTASEVWEHFKVIKKGK